MCRRTCCPFFWGGIGIIGSNNCCRCNASCGNSNRNTGNNSNSGCCCNCNCCSD